MKAVEILAHLVKKIGKNKDSKSLLKKLEDKFTLISETVVLSLKDSKGLGSK